MHYSGKLFTICMIQYTKKRLQTTKAEFWWKQWGRWKKIQRRWSGLAHDPHGKLELKTGQSQRRDVLYACGISVLMNYDCTTHLILPFITITTKFLSKHCIKRVFDTEMNGYHCFNFTEKLSYEVQTLSNQKMSNFHFDLSLKLSQGEVYDFSGEVARCKNSQGRCKTTSGEVRTSFQNPAMQTTNINIKALSITIMLASMQVSFFS